MTPLTPAQRKVYDAIVELTDDGWPVSIRTIMQTTGHSSTSTVHEHLMRLENSGHIKIHPRNPKGGWLPCL